MLKACRNSACLTLSLLLLLAVLNGCGSSAGGPGGSTAPSGAPVAYVPEDGIPMPSLQQQDLVFRGSSLNLLPGWNSFTCPAIGARRFATVWLSSATESKLLKETADANWTLPYVLYFSRVYYQLDTANDDNLFQPGWRYWIYAKKSGLSLRLADPYITSLAPPYAVSGDSVTLRGFNFGATQGASTVSFNGSSLSGIISWSDTAIVITVPAGFTCGSASLRVTVSGTLSNIAMLGFAGVGWHNTWGGGAWDSFNELCRDAAGNIYAAGSTESFGAGQSDCLVVKYDASGTLLWQKTWGGENWDNAYGITLDRSGNIYVAGSTDSFSPDNNSDTFLLKYSPAGNLLWQKTWGGASWDNANDVVADSLGNIYVAGESNSFSSADSSIVMLKYSSAGNLIMQKIYGTSSYNAGWRMAVDRFNYIYITGWQGAYGAGNGDAYILKLNPNGTIVWQKTWGGDNWDNGYDIAVDAGCNVFVTGNTGSFGDTNGDTMLLKYSSAGKLLLQKIWQTPGWDSGQAVNTDSAGNIYVGGNMAIPGNEGSYLFLLKFTASGNLLWQNLYGDSGYMDCYGMQISPEGNILMAGDTESITRFWQDTQQPVITPANTENFAGYTPLGITGSTAEVSGTQTTPAGSEFYAGMSDCLLVNLPAAGTFGLRLDGVQPCYGFPGFPVTLTGTKFGSSQGGGSVSFSGTVVPVTSWCDSAIVCNIPGGISGPVQVRLQLPEQNSNPVWFNIATNYYVDAATGNDNNDGSLGAPFKTITRGMAATHMGDILNVAEGNYTSESGELFPIILKNQITLKGGYNTGFTQWNPDTYPAVLDAQNSAQVLRSNDDAKAGTTLDGMIITQGSGGGIEIPYRSALTVQNCKILNNSSSNGGGINCQYNAQLVMQNCEVSGNWSSGPGGGISCYDSVLEIINSRFFHNTADGGGGGAIELSNCRISNPIIRNCVLSYNHGSFGGAICASDSICAIVGCTITDNTTNSGYYGGGIYLSGSLNQSVVDNCTISNNRGEACGGGVCFSSYATGEIKNCLISLNTSGYEGGGISCMWSSPVIRNCLLLSNNSGDGGGICCRYGSAPEISNCTFKGNSASRGGGINCIQSGDDPVITSCLLSGNSGWGGGIYAQGGANPTIIYNNVWGNTPNDYGQCAPGIGCISLDPLWVNPGGGDFHLLAESPCIDAGNPAYAGYLLDGNWETQAGIPDFPPVDMGYHYRR